MKKLLALFLTLCMLLSVVSVMAVNVGADGETADATALTPDTAWYDNHKEATDLYIGTAAELLGFSKLISTQLLNNKDFDAATDAEKIFVGKTIHITADIDLNPGWTAGETAPTNKWLSQNYHGFTGMIDGGGHTISGIYLSTTANHTGIFGNARGGTAEKPVGVKNLTIKNSYVASTKNIVSGLFGSIPASEANKNRFVLIENINMEITVVGATTEVGSAFGYVTEGNQLTIRNCFFQNTIRGTATTKIGGIIGGGSGTIEIQNNYVNNTQIWETLADAVKPNKDSPARPSSQSGGVVGCADSGATLTIRNTVVASTMETVNNNISVRPTGGFVGDSHQKANVTIENSMFCGIDNSLNNWNGGFIGIVRGTAKIDKCIGAGVLTPAPWTVDFNASGAIIGQAQTNTIEVSNCLYTDIYLAVKNAGYILAESMVGLLKNGKDPEEVKKTNNHHVTPAEITGLAAAEKLTAAGMTDWTVTTTGLPLPRSIVTTFGETILAKADEAETPVTKLAGYQVSDAADNKFDLRLVATLKLADDNKTVTDGKVSNYTSVGFRVVANYGTTTKAKDYTTDMVYSAISGYTKGETAVTEYTAESLGGDYLFVLPCRNVPANAGVITMEVTTYYTAADGTVVLGATQVFTVDPAATELH